MRPRSHGSARLHAPTGAPVLARDPARRPGRLTLRCHHPVSQAVTPVGGASVQDGNFLARGMALACSDLYIDAKVSLGRHGPPSELRAVVKLSSLRTAAGSTNNSRHMTPACGGSATSSRPAPWMDAVRRTSTTAYAHTQGRIRPDAHRCASQHLERTRPLTFKRREIS